MNCPLGLLAVYDPEVGIPAVQLVHPEIDQGTTIRTLLGGLQVTQATWFSTRRTCHFGGDIVCPPLSSTRGRRAHPTSKNWSALKASIHPGTDCLYGNGKIQ